MNPFPTFWHNFQISNIPSFWDIHVCNLSLRCVLCVFSWYCTRFVIFDWVHVVYKKNPSLYMKDESVPTFWHNFQIFNKPSFWDIYVCILICDVFCVFFHDIVLDSSFLTGFTLYTRKILHYTRKMNPFPTFWHNFQISNIPSFWDIHVCNLSLRCVLCVFSWYCTRFVIFDWVHVVYKKNPSLYMKDESVPTFWHNFQIFNKPSFWDIYVCILICDVFCVFFHDIVLDSSFLTGFTLYTRKILHYTRKMNPFPTFWHNFQISNIPSFWDIHVCNLSLRCVLCVFSWYCTRFVIFDWVPVVYKKNPSLYKKDESFPNILTQFSDLQHA